MDILRDTFISPGPNNDLAVICLSIQCSNLESWIVDPHQVVQEDTGQNHPLGILWTELKCSQQVLESIGQESEGVLHNVSALRESIVEYRVIPRDDGAAGPAALRHDQPRSTAVKGQQASAKDIWCEFG